MRRFALLVALLVLSGCGSSGPGADRGRDSFVGTWGSMPRLVLEDDGTAELTDGCQVSYGTWEYGSGAVRLAFEERSQASPCGYAQQLGEVVDGAEAYDGTLRLTSSAADGPWVLRDDASPVCTDGAVPKTVKGKETCQLRPGSV